MLNHGLPDVAHPTRILMCESSEKGLPTGVVEGIGVSKYDCYSKD